MRFGQGFCSMEAIMHKIF